jgi:hypothetical protein
MTGTLDLYGDTGLDTTVFSAAADIIGKPVTVPIYSEAVDTGAGTSYTIVGFVGVRIVDVVGTGANKRIVIQPAIVVDDSAISGSGNSYAVYQPVVLVR